MSTVYAIVYFVGGNKQLHRRCFTDQGLAGAFAVANQLDSWHLIQLELTGEED